MVIENCNLAFRKAARGLQPAGCNVNPIGGFGKMGNHHFLREDGAEIFVSPRTHLQGLDRGQGPFLERFPYIGVFIQ